MKIKAFLKRYGFYVLVACCVVAIAVVAYAAVGNLIGSTEIEPDTGDETPTWDIPEKTPEKQEDISPSQPDSESDLPSQSPQSDSEQPSSSVSAIIEPQMPQYVSPTASLAILQGFSGDKAVFNETLGEWRTHNGADYVAAAGESVYAVYGGTVSFCGERDLWGTTIELTLDTGYTAVYCGVTPDAALTVGMRVEKGDVIGTLGGNPLIEASAETHLHFEMKTANAYADPSSIINP